MAANTIAAAMPLPARPRPVIEARRIAKAGLAGTFSGCSLALINPRNQPRRAAAVGVVLVAELRAQQPLFRLDARDERRNRERRQKHGDHGTKGQRPSQGVDEQAQIARVTNDAIDPARDQRMPALDGDEPAEPAAEHEHRPDPQRTAGGEENDAKPANGVAVEGPEILPIRVGRQIGEQNSDHAEGREHPAVAFILALAGTEISAAEQRDTRQHEAPITRTIRAGWEKKAAKE